MPTNKSNLYGEKLGTIVLRLEDGTDYVCTSVSIDMEINNIPSAMVTIGAGTGIRGTRNKQDPETLLSAILSRRDAESSAYARMVECKLVEIVETAFSISETPIFSGLIVTGNIVYKTGSPTVKMIRLQCMNKVIELYSNPTCQFSTVTGQFLIDYMTAYGNSELAASKSMASQTEADKVPIIKEISLMAHPESMPLVDRIADIVSHVVYAKDYAKLKGGAGSNSYGTRIKNCFCGKARLNPNPGDIQYDINGGTIGMMFDKEIGEILIAKIENDSVYNTLQSILLSDKYMLMFIPRWYDEDFKMEIAPSRAWDVNANNIIKIPINKISSFDTSYNPIACIQTPNVFLVNFEDAVSTLHGEVTCQVVGRPGVYSVNKKALEQWQSALQNKTFPSEDFINKAFNARMYNAPKWITPLVLKEGTMAAQDRDTIDKMKTTDNPGEKTLKMMGNQAESAGDMLAKALFTFLYGSEDKCNIELLPSERFGKDKDLGIKALEQRLGDTVDIKFAEENSSMNIRGMLSKISYTYTCGAGNCQVGYTISLSRVRMLNENEESIPCPIYTY